LSPWLGEQAKWLNITGKEIADKPWCEAAAVGPVAENIDWL